MTCTVNCASFTWADKSGNLPDIPVDSIIVNPNFAQQVFAGTDFGLYYTDNVNHTNPIWYRFTAGLPTVMIWDMATDRGNTTLSLWTRSRGAYAWPLASEPPHPTDHESERRRCQRHLRRDRQPRHAYLGGNPVSGKSVAFALNGTGVGSVVTDMMVLPRSTAQASPR